MMIFFPLVAGSRLLTEQASWLDGRVVAVELSTSKRGKAEFE
jgi:hypothetical protein